MRNDNFIKLEKHMPRQGDPETTQNRNPVAANGTRKNRYTCIAHETVSTTGVDH